MDAVRAAIPSAQIQSGEPADQRDHLVGQAIESLEDSKTQNGHAQSFWRNASLQASPGQPINLIPKRNRLVKVMLSHEELRQLDVISRDTGLDRSSVMRHLFLTSSSLAPESAAHETYQAKQKPITRINVTDIGAKASKPTIRICEPRTFDEMSSFCRAIRDGIMIMLNLTMMEPDQAQRAVDFVAGATFNVDGHQERVGESIFLFAPEHFEVQTSAGSSEDDNGSPNLITSANIEPQTGDESTQETIIEAQASLTALQLNFLGLIEKKWEDGQQETTSAELVESLITSGDPRSAARLARRTLFFLAKQKYIDIKIHGSDMVSRPAKRDEAQELAVIK